MCEKHRNKVWLVPRLKNPAAAGRPGECLNSRSDKEATKTIKNQTPSLLLPVEHEEPGVGAALSRLQEHHQTAHRAAMPAQRLPHVCLRGLGCQRLPASRASRRAQFASLHAKHPLPPPGPPAHAQSWAAAYRASATGRSGIRLHTPQWLSNVFQMISRSNNGMFVWCIFLAHICFVFFPDWRSPPTFTLHAPVPRTWDVSGATA